eukprot:946496-Pelagomonas_calceolata.AAC.2
MCMRPVEEAQRTSPQDNSGSCTATSDEVCICIIHHAYVYMRLVEDSQRTSPQGNSGSCAATSDEICICITAGTL